MKEAAFDEILESLVDGEVEFILIGGLALNSWGVVRGTKDVDVVAAPTSENLNRLAQVAEGLGGHIEGAEVFASTSFSMATQLASGERVLIQTPKGALDVVQGLPGVLPFEELQRDAVLVVIGQTSVPVCSLPHLRAMKRAAGRTRDLADLEDLDAAHGPDAWQA